ncbi:MAG: glycosyltransferase [Kiritimatiellae bacterium]|nr:glycosyltransferase [Kiritimatiellia bacterium]
MEPFFGRCLDSVEAQDFGDWEMVAVVEASRDGTERAVRAAAARDPRIRVLSGLPRSGSCSVPRNLGVESAAGRYVVFLDGDDALAPGALGRAARGIAAEPDADLYPCRLLLVDDTRPGLPVRWEDNYPADVSGPLSGPEATLAAGARGWRPRPGLQMTVFRRGFLLERGLRCIPGLRCQDVEFSPRALYLARKVVPLHFPLCEYHRREGSIQTGRRTAGEFLPDLAAVFRSLFAFHAETSAAAGFDRRVSSRWACQWLPVVFHEWFARNRVAEIPRGKRLETLRLLFAGGSAAFDSLLRSAPFPLRLAGRFARLSAFHPRFAPLSEFFFANVHYPLLGLRGSVRAFAGRFFPAPPVPDVPLPPIKGTPSTVVTVADRNYAWGALMLVASMRMNGMGNPVVVGARGWDRKMRMRLRSLGGVKIADMAEGDRCAACDKPQIMTRPEVGTDWVCFVDADGVFKGDCSDFLHADDEDEFMMRRHDPPPADFTPENLGIWRRDVGKHQGRALPRSRMDTRALSGFVAAHRKWFPFLRRWKDQMEKVLPPDVGIVMKRGSAYFQTDESVLSSLLCFFPDAPRVSATYKAGGDLDPSRKYVHFGYNPKPWTMWNAHAARFRESAYAVADWLVERGVVARRDLPLPLRRGAWPLYRLLVPLAPWVWRAMKLRRKLFK